MGEKKKKKEGKKGLVLKGLLFFLIALLLLSGVTVCYALRRIGSAPSEAEKAFFAKLPNYKNGKFLNYDKVELSTRKFAKKPGFFRFIFASSNAPKRPYPRRELIRKSFPDRPEEFNVCWLGHSSLIFELGGVRFMVDPVFGNAAPSPGSSGALSPPLSPVKSCLNWISWSFHTITTTIWNMKRSAVSETKNSPSSPLWAWAPGCAAGGSPPAASSK